MLSRALKRTVAGVGLMLAGVPSSGQIAFVDDDAQGAGDGTSWTDAFTDLQVALAAVRADHAGYDEIWIAGGVYTPAPPGGDRSVWFELSGHPVRGGFAGTETDPSQRPPADDPSAPETVLSGDLDGDDEGGANLEDNARLVVWGSVPVVLDRLTIAHGYRGRDDPPSPALPAALSSIARDLLMTDCVIRDNRVDSLFGGLGAGVYARPAEGARFERCSFVNNTVTGDISAFGGSLYVTGDEVDIDSCVFESNSVSSFNSAKGGAIYSAAASTHVTNSEFRGNSATATQGQPGWFNEAVGGAINAQDPFGAQIGDSLIVEGCTFESNTASATATGTAEPYGNGGAIGSSFMTAIRSSEFQQNRAEAFADATRGVALGAALAMGFDPPSVELTDCLFMGNTAVTNTDALRGGTAFLTADGPVTIERCTFGSNAAERMNPLLPTSTDRAVGVLELNTGSASIVDSGFNGNTIAVEQSGLGADTFAAIVRIRADEGVELRRCVVSGNTVSIADEGIGDARPAATVEIVADIVGVDALTLRGNAIDSADGTPFTGPQPSAGLLLNAGEITVSNTLVAGNEAPGVAGIVLADPTPLSAVVLNSTIADNTTESGDPAGLLAEIPAEVVNTVFWSNRSAAPGMLAQQLVIDAGVQMASSIDSSIVEGWDGSLPGARTNADDPGFSGPDDYRLRSGSHAIDSGDNTALPPALVSDLAGNPRRADDPGTADTGVGVTPVVDRGAFEFTPVPCGPADLVDPLGVLDLADIVAFVTAFTGADPIADFAEPEGVFDLADIVAFVAAFNGGCP